MRENHGLKTILLVATVVTIQVAAEVVVTPHLEDFNQEQVGLV